MNRRNFLSAVLAAGVAPAIVRASSLMVIRRPLIVPEILRSTCKAHDWLDAMASMYGIYRAPSEQNEALKNRLFHYLANPPKTQ